MNTKNAKLTLILMLAATAIALVAANAITGKNPLRYDTHYDQGTWIEDLSVNRDQARKKPRL